MNLFLSKLMSETNSEENLNNISEIVEEDEKLNEDNEEPKPIKKVEIVLTPNKTQRSDKTKFEVARDSKQRAIDNFKNGITDPEYRVVKMTNGKFRCYKRKQPLIVEPINVNQIQPNLPTQTINEQQPEPIMKAKPAAKQHSPFDDIVYFNLSNQLGEQLNKRLDAVNAEIERLRNKNSKLKNKYRQLKQAIFITEEEEHDEPQQMPQERRSVPASQVQQVQQQQIPNEQFEPIQQQQQQIPQIQQVRRVGGINFNRFFQ